MNTIYKSENFSDAIESQIKTVWPLMSKTNAYPILFDKYDIK